MKAELRISLSYSTAYDKSIAKARDVMYMSDQTGQSMRHRVHRKSVRRDLELALELRLLSMRC